MTTGNAQAVRARGRSNKPKHDLFKIKDLIGIPWRVAFALQQDGWYLRQDIIWHKPNPMPESVTDRCTKSHEYIFLLSKSSKYYFDSEAMKQPSVGGGTRNRRSVWTVSTKPFKGAHFATFPPELIEPCVLSGCPVDGTVLDPFGGSGTTAGVAVSHNRNAIICELNPEYASLVEDRVKHISFNKKTLL
jgi:site-specific DNA-methyltransferase (adenine-specific)